MSIVLARLDNRLIHGQILEAWVPIVRADCIVVANDEVAGEPFGRQLMAAAVPRGIRVVIGTIEEVVSLLASGDLAKYRILLLFAGSGDALKGHRLGIRFESLNLGNMHGGKGKRRLSCTLALDPPDVENFRRLEAAGVWVVCQCLPSDRERDWKDLLRTMEG